MEPTDEKTVAPQSSPERFVGPQHFGLVELLSSASSGDAHQRLTQALLQSGCFTVSVDVRDAKAELSSAPSQFAAEFLREHAASFNDDLVALEETARAFFDETHPGYKTLASVLTPERLGYAFMTSPQRALARKEDRPQAHTSAASGVESFTLKLPQRDCPLLSGAPVPWPLLPLSFEPVVRRAFAALVCLGKLLAALVLGDSFVERALACRDVHTAYEPSVMFLRRYRAAFPSAGAHTDSGVLTLMPADSCRGLEVLSRSSDCWHPVKLPRVGSGGHDGAPPALRVLVFGGEELVAAMHAVRHTNGAFLHDLFPTAAEWSRRVTEFATVHRVNVRTPSLPVGTDATDPAAATAGAAAPFLDRMTMPTQLRLPASWPRMLGSVSATERSAGENDGAARDGELQLQRTSTGLGVHMLQL